jgi:hypothetical protein
LKYIVSFHSAIPSFSSPLTGEDEGGGEKYFLVQSIIVSPSPLSPPARGGEIESGWTRVKNITRLLLILLRGSA